MNDKIFTTFYLALLVLLSSLLFNRFVPYIAWVMYMAVYASYMWISFSSSEGDLSDDAEQRSTPLPHYD